jgi:hypothetical protein
MIEFNQIISDGDYKRAIAKHYFGYKYTYISPILGLLTLLGLITITFLYKGFFSETSIVLYLLAFFMLLRPILYINNVYTSIKTSKLSSNELNIKFTDDAKLITSSNGNQTSLNLADLYAYYNTKLFLFLYLSRNQYIILDKRQLNDSNASLVVQVLDSLKIKRR